VGWFSKPKDPMTARQERLEREIAQLQRRIADLSTQPLPPVRPSVRPPSPTPAQSSRPVPTPAPRPSSGIPAVAEHGAPHTRYNLAEALARLKARFGGRPRPPSGLVNLMAAGSVHGLQPLRYERKIARRRFILSLSFLLLVLYGIARVIFRDGL